MNASAFFITATGTDIGKTTLAVEIVKRLRLNGNKAVALKPLVTGFDEQSYAASDTARLGEAIGINQHQNQDNESKEKFLAELSPFRFRAPLAPSMAAAAEGCTIDYAAVLSWCRAALAKYNNHLTFIEGVGGVMVPIDDTHTTLDWMADLALPVLLVTGGYLGTISHTLTAYAALRSRGLAVSAVILNRKPTEDITEAATIIELQKHLGSADIMNMADFVSRFVNNLTGVSS